MPTEDRRVGKLLPNPVTPTSDVCFTIRIPNAVQYRAAFLGQINVLGQALTWDHPTDGTTCVDCEEAAQLWRNAIYQATFSDDCEANMSCLDVANCIDTDEAVRSAVNKVIQPTQRPGVTNVPGERLPDSYWEGDLFSNPDCDFDSFWAQCKAFTDYLVGAGNDFFEQLEVWSNAVEAAGFIEAIPVVGTIVDEAQIDQVLKLIDWVLETVAEFYAGADTEEARIGIACAMFCAQRDQCEMSLEDVWGILNDRLGGVFTPADIASIDDLLDSATTIITNPALPLDAWILFVVSMGRVLGYLGIQGIDKTLNIMLRVASDQPNNDWEVLCEDCPASWCYVIDFEVTNGASVGVSLTGVPLLSGAGAVWQPGKGLVRSTDQDADKTFAVLLPTSPALTMVIGSATLEWGYEDASGNGNVWLNEDYGTAHGIESPDVSYVNSYVAPLSNLVFGGERAGADLTPFIYIKKLTLRGEGDIPPQFVASNC